MGIHAFELQVRNNGIKTAILNKGSNNVNPDQTITDDKQPGTWVKAGAPRKAAARQHAGAIQYTELCIMMWTV